MKKKKKNILMIASFQRNLDMKTYLFLHMYPLGKMIIQAIIHMNLTAKKNPTIINISKVLVLIMLDPRHSQSIGGLWMIENKIKIKEKSKNLIIKKLKTLKKYKLKNHLQKLLLKIIRI